MQRTVTPASTVLAVRSVRLNNRFKDHLNRLHQPLVEQSKRLLAPLTEDQPVHVAA